MAQCSACRHDQWQGYMTVLVMNHGMIQSIRIITAVIRAMIKFDLDTLWDWFRQDVKWTLIIRCQLSTLYALDLDWVHHIPHPVLRERILIICQKRINEFQTLCGGFKAVEILKLCNGVSW